MSTTRMQVCTCLALTTPRITRTGARRCRRAPISGMMQRVFVTDSDRSTGPLGDLQILDFARILAGPFATMMLADLGATVTKVERPGVGDETRSWGPPFDERGQATYFQAVNRNKHSLVLDLGAGPGRERALELARASDVVVENFRPGVMDRLGLG